MSNPPWREALANAVASGLAEDGFLAVSGALSDQYAGLAEHPDAPIDPLTPQVAVLAVTGCETGRLGVLLGTDARLSVHLGRTTSAIIDQVQESTEIGLLVFAGEADTDVRGGFATEVVAPYDGPADLAERREFLRLAGLTTPAWFSGSGFTEAELLDACGAVVVAVGRTGRMDP